MMQIDTYSVDNSKALSKNAIEIFLNSLQKRETPFECMAKSNLFPVYEAARDGKKFLMVDTPFFYVFFAYENQKFPSYEKNTGKLFYGIILDNYLLFHQENEYQVYSIASRKTFIPPAFSYEEKRLLVLGTIQSDSIWQIYTCYDIQSQSINNYKMIDNYVYISVLGQGGMGVVYKVYDITLQRKVALKTIIDDTSFTLFQREAKILARLFHPNIVNIHDFSISKRYFTMDLIDGYDLKSWLLNPIETFDLKVYEQNQLKKNFLPEIDKLQNFFQGKEIVILHRKKNKTSWTIWEKQKNKKYAIRLIKEKKYGLYREPTYIEIAQMMKKITFAISYAHKNNIIHLDLKPANVLIDKNTEEPYVMDFGLAKSKLSIERNIASQRGNISVERSMVGGTPLNMSYEQAYINYLMALGEGIPANTPWCDERSDLYSTGTILYFLLTQKELFDLTNANLKLTDALKIIMDHVPKKPSFYEKDVPEDIQQICLKSIEKKKENRYQSMEDFEKDLDRFMNQEPVLAREGEIVYIFTKFARKHWILSLILSILCIATISISYLWNLAEKQRNIAQEERKSAQKEKNIAENMAVKAKKAGVQALLSASQSKYSEAESHISIATMLISSDRNYIEAKNHIAQASKLCSKGMEMLNSLEKYYLEESEKEKLFLFEDGYKKLIQKIEDIEKYQTTPNPYTPATIEIPEDYEACFTYRPSYRFLATKKKGEKKRTFIFDLQQDFPFSKPEAIIEHDSDIKYIEFSRDNLYFAFGDEQGTIKILDISKKEIKEIIDNPIKKNRAGTLDSIIRGITFSHGSQYMAVLAGNMTVIYHLPDLTVVQILPLGGKYSYASCFSPDNQWLAMAGVTTRFPSEMGGTKLYSTNTWEENKYKNIYGKALCFHPNSLQIAIALDSRLVIWDPQKNIEKLFKGHQSDIISLCASNDGRFLASLGQDSQVALWDILTQERLATIPLTSEAYSLSFSPHKEGNIRERLMIWQWDKIVTYDLDGSLTFKSNVLKKKLPSWELCRDKIQLENIDTLIKDSWQLEISPVNTNFIAGNIYSIPFLMNLKEQNIAFLKQNKFDKSISFSDFTRSKTRNIYFNCDGTYLACLSLTNLKIWDIESSTQILQLNTKAKCFQFSTSQKDVFAIGNDEHLAIYQIIKSKEKFSLDLKSKNESLANAEAIAWSPHDAFLAVALDKGSLLVCQFNSKFFDLKTEYELCDLFHIQSICFALDSKALGIGFKNGKFLIKNKENKNLENPLNLGGLVQKIYFDEQKKIFWIITDSSIFLHRYGVNDKLNVYPIELYPGYLKNCIAISKECKDIVFISHNEYILVMSQ